MKGNTGVFLQNIIKNDEACRVMATVGWRRTFLTYYDFGQRIYEANKEGIKFGFVVKKLK